MMFDIKYQGIRIEPTLASVRELLKYDKDLADVLEILENGYDCGASDRKPNVIERCIKRDDKEIKTVVAKVSVKYADGFKEELWRLIHFGVTAFKKR